MTLWIRNLTKREWLLAALYITIGLVLGGMAACADEAYAWVGGVYPPFKEESSATVIMQPYCMIDDCSPYTTIVDYPANIEAALKQWEWAKAAFTIHRGHNVPPDPCHAGEGTVVFILTDSNNLCPGDGPLNSGGRAELKYDMNRVLIYLNVENYTIRDGQPFRLILHELGHAWGLGHPDDFGQKVQAVMNSTIYYLELQEDDLRGMAALYPHTPVEPRTPVQEQAARPKGFLENPRDGSSQSGVGVISGWVCEAELVEVLIWSRGSEDYKREPVSYGTNRVDTAEVCDDADNGFGLLFNWNRLGPGDYIIDVLVDEAWLGRSEITVTTLGEEFLRGVEGEYVLEDFPYPGSSVVIEWEQSLQNFVISDHHE